MFPARCLEANLLETVSGRNKTRRNNSMGLNQRYNSSGDIYITFLILTILSNLATTEGVSEGL